MSEVISGIGPIIATYIGTGISIFSAIAACRAKSKVEKYRDELKIRIQDKELTGLIEKGKKAKDIVNNISSAKITTTIGKTQEEDEKQIKDFLSGINENKHLINNPTVDKLYLRAKDHFKQQKYNDLFYNISDIISILKQHTDSNITRE